MDAGQTGTTHRTGLCTVKQVAPPAMRECIAPVLSKESMLETEVTDGGTNNGTGGLLAVGGADQGARGVCNVCKCSGKSQRRLQRE